MFVVDGEPSPLKTQSRMERFFRCSGIELAELPKNEPGSPVKQRNQHFAKCISDCVVRFNMPFLFLFFSEFVELEEEKPFSLKKKTRFSGCIMCFF